MSFGAPPPGMDEYQRLMVERAAAQKRKQMIFGVVALAVVGGGVFFYQKDAGKKKSAQAILDAGGRFAERDKADMGCVLELRDGDRRRRRVRSRAGIRSSSGSKARYFTQQKTYSEHLTTECVPKIEAARGAVSGLVNDVPVPLRPSLEKYVAALPKMQEGLEIYAEKLKSRGATKDVDGSIQEVGTAFSPEPTAESVAFEKFLVCAIPDLDKKKDIQGVLEFLAEICKKDPVVFMTKVRADCGALVQKVDKDAKPSPSKTFKANAKKFYEEDQRQLQAWEYCGKRSRKGKKQLDLEQFLTASGDYMEARNEMVKTAREEAARITGQPLPKEKKAAPGAPGAAE